MEYQCLEIEIRDRVGILSLNRPDSLNALTPRLVEELLHATQDLPQHCRAMILTAKGRFFCSGASLDPAEPLSPLTNNPAERDLGKIVEDKLNPLINQLRDLPIPWISAIRGGAAGYGASLALAADMVVTTEGSYFAQIFSRIGLVPDGGSTHLLTRNIGRVRTMEMLLLGEKLPADKALAWGLVNRVVSTDELEEEAFDLALRLANGPSQSLAMIRNAVWAAVDGNWQSNLDNERNMQRTAGRHPDFDEGVAAFLEKRPPKFGQ